MSKSRYQCGDSVIAAESADTRRGVGRTGFGKTDRHAVNGLSFLEFFDLELLRPFFQVRRIYMVVTAKPMA
jgi:hypothetical protein